MHPIVAYCAGVDADLLAKAGCRILSPVPYLLGHPALFARPEGRHRNVFTKLRVLGLIAYRKVSVAEGDDNLGDGRARSMVIHSASACNVKRRWRTGVILS